MEFKIGELSEEHQKYNRNTHIQTHTQTPHARTHKMFKTAHVSQKYLLALKGVLNFC